MILFQDCAVLFIIMLPSLLLFCTLNSWFHEILACTTSCC